MGLNKNQVTAKLSHGSVQRKLNGPKQESIRLLHSHAASELQLL